MSANQVLVPLFDKETRVPDLFVDQKTQVIYFLKSINNRKLKFSTKIRAPNILKAKRVANLELTKRLGKKKSRVTPLIRDELENWVRSKESENHKPLTLKNIRNARKQIEGFWGDMFPHEINKDNLGPFYDWFSATYPGQQKENAIKYLRNFSRYLAQKVVNGVPLLPTVPDIPNPDYKEVRAQRKKRKENIFTSSDFKKIYDAGNEDERIVCLFMYTMASRIDETLNLRFGHEILLDRKTPIYKWQVGQNKADLTGQHALHPSLIEPLKSLYARRKAEGTNRLFPQQGDKSKALKPQMIDWSAWRKRAALDWHWTSHTFRHTCLSLLFNNPNNPQALICKLYRVSFAVAMDVYIKPTEEGIEKMRTAIEVLI
jgi:integrase